LEVPLTHKGKLMVTEEYIEFLLTIANQKMEENKRRIGRYSQLFIPMLLASAHVILGIGEHVLIVQTA
jgi:tRNA(Phe) wybutosine-synthesizing methylase Tyw3